MVPFERALVISYRPSIVTFRLSSRISEILPLLCSSTPLFSTPPLISPNFPHVPLGVGGRPLPLGYEERRTVVQLVSKLSNLCGPDPRTYRRTGTVTTWMGDLSADR